MQGAAVPLLRRATGSGLGFCGTWRPGNPAQMGRARIRLCSSKSAAGSAEKPSSIGARRFLGKLRLNAPLKIVLDTNVVLDWLVFHNPGVAPVADAIEQSQMLWIGTADTLGELQHVLRNAQLAGRAVDMERALASIHRLLVLVPVPGALPLTRCRCSDASDQKFIDLALTEQASWLLTRDRAVLKLARKTSSAGLLIQVPERWQLNATAPPTA